MNLQQPFHLQIVAGEPLASGVQRWRPSSAPAAGHESNSGSATMAQAQLDRAAPVTRQVEVAGSKGSDGFQRRFAAAC